MSENCYLMPVPTDEFEVLIRRLIAAGTCPPSDRENLKEDLLASNDVARHIVAGLIQSGADLDSLEFFMRACNGNMDKAWRAASGWELPTGGIRFTEEFVNEVRSQCGELARNIRVINGFHEDEANPAEFVINTHGTLSIDENRQADEEAIYRTQLSELFHLMPDILLAYGTSLRPWWNSKSRTVPVNRQEVKRESLKALFSFYAQMIRESTAERKRNPTLDHVAELLTLARVALRTQEEPTTAASLKTTVWRFRQHKASMHRAIREYLKLTSPRPSFVQAAGLTAGTPSQDVMKHLHLPRKQRRQRDK